ncbi:MAG TPA: hypothetical protein VJ570_11290 [Holophagaceae bacterium]|nr:hypothetical protein [Holophagaceae bacterium]
MSRALPALVLAATALVAQPAPGQGQGLQALRQFMMQRLQDRVGLSEPQARGVADRWERYNREHFDRQQQLGQLRQRFQDILLGPGDEDQKSAKVKPLLEQFLDLRKRQMEAKQRFEDDIRAGLTPAQQARLVVTVDEMIQQIADRLKDRPLLKELRREQREGEGRPRRPFNRN